MNRQAQLLILAIFLALLFPFNFLRSEIFRSSRRPEKKSEISTAELPGLLWEKGQALEEKGSYAEAEDTYKELVDDYPDSLLAPRAQFRQAVCLEKEDKLYKAFRAYQKLLENYPGKGDLGEILERQFRIGEAFLEGRKRYFLFFRIRSGLSTAAEIFSVIVGNATFSRIAPRAQYSLGLTLQKQGKYEEAELEYDLFLDNYSGSDVVGPTIFQMGVCSYQRALQSDYDQKTVNKAVKYFKKFLKRFPQDPRREEAEEFLNQLISRKAEKAYRTATFYEKKGSPEGARIYYEEVIRNYPDSSWAERARKKLTALPAPKSE